MKRSPLGALAPGRAHTHAEPVRSARIPDLRNCSRARLSGNRGRRKPEHHPTVFPAHRKISGEEAGNSPPIFPDSAFARRESRKDLVGLSSRKMSVPTGLSLPRSMKDTNNGTCTAPPPSVENKGICLDCACTMNLPATSHDPHSLGVLRGDCVVKGGQDQAPCTAFHTRARKWPIQSCRGKGERQGSQSCLHGQGLHQSGTDRRHPQGNRSKWISEQEGGL